MLALALVNQAYATLPVILRLCARVNLVSVVTLASGSLSTYQLGHADGRMRGTILVGPPPALDRRWRMDERHPLSQCLYIHENVAADIIQRRLDFCWFLDLFLYCVCIAVSMGPRERRLLGLQLEE